MRKLVMVLAVLMVAFAVLIGAAALAVESRWLSGFLQEKLSERLGRQISWAGTLQVDWSLHPTIQVDELRLDNAAWAKHDYMAHAQTLVARVDLTQIFAGRLAVERLLLEQPVAHLARSQEHGANWAPLVPEQKGGKPLLQPTFGKIVIDQGRGTYRAPWQNTEIAVAVNTAVGPEQDRRLLVEGSGELLGKAISLQLVGDPPKAVVGAGDEPVNYDLLGELHWHEHELRVQGEIVWPEQLKAAAFDVVASGPNADAAADLLGYSTRSAPYEASARVRFDNDAWKVQKLLASLGDTRLQGQLGYESSGELPLVTADLELNQLNVNQTLPFLFEEVEVIPEEIIPEKPVAQTQPLKEVLAPLSHFNADVELAIGQLQVNGTTLQNLLADILLKDGLLRLEPVHVGVGDGEVKVTGTINAEGKAANGELVARVDSVDLGEAIAGAAQDSLGVVDGRLVLKIVDGAPALGDSKFSYSQPSVDTQLAVTTGFEPQKDAAPKLEVAAHGKWRSEPLDLQLVSGPLMDIFKPQEPYPVDLSGSLAEASVNVEGTVTNPLQLQDARLQVSLSADGTEGLSSLSGLSLPTMPPFELGGRLVREDNSWYFRDLDATVAQSQLTGNLRWQLYEDQRPMFWADLYSKHLELSDLTALADAGNEDESSEQTAATEDKGDLRQALKTLNARVKFHGQKVIASNLHLKDVILELRLEDEVLTVAPLEVGLAQGEIHSELTLDASDLPVEGSAEFTMRRVHLGALLEPVEAELVDQSAGVIGGEGDFTFNGNDFKEMLASLGGEMRLLMESGQLDALLVEALGLDATEVLISLVGEKPDPVTIQCAYTELEVNDGVAKTEGLVVATSDSNIIGDGRANLAERHFSLTLEANPKDFSVLSVSSPVRIHGSFTDPQIDVISKELLARGALAALGAALFPPAALLPLIELGEASGQRGCQDYIASHEP